MNTLTFIAILIVLSVIIATVGQLIFASMWQKHIERVITTIQEEEDNE